MDLATAFFYFCIAFICLGMTFTLIKQQVYSTSKTSGKDQKLSVLYRHGELDLEKVLCLLEKEFGGQTTVGIITETVMPKKPVSNEPEKSEVMRNIYVRKPTDPHFFLCTTFFNMLPEYFTLQAELMLIEDMGIEATAQAYDRSSIDTLIKELLESKSVEDKEYYTNLLLDIKAKQKA